MQLQYQKEIIASLLDYPEESERVKNELGLSGFDEPYRTALGIIFDNRETEEPEALILLVRDLPKFPTIEILDIKPSTSLIYLETLLSKASLELQKEKILNLVKNENSTITLYEELKDVSDQYLNSYSANSIKPYHEDLSEIIEDLQTNLASEKNNNLKSTRFPKLNEITGGFNKSNLIAVAGVFKSGKTSFALSLLLDFLKQNIPVCFFSLELSKEELVKKVISYETGIRYSSLRNPKQLTDNERKDLSRYWNTEKKLKRNLYVLSDSLSIFELKSKIRILKEAGVNTFFLDYIGYIKSDSNFDSRERELTFYSNYLKRTAKELDVTLFLLAQLNRSGKYDPSSINLAESIGLARDCDFLFTISAASFFKSEVNKRYGNISLDNKFVLKLDSSRHSEQGKSILLEFTSYGMQQAETFGNDYSESYRNYNETEQETLI